MSRVLGVCVLSLVSCTLLSCAAAPRGGRESRNKRDSGPEARPDTGRPTDLDAALDEVARRIEEAAGREGVTFIAIEDFRNMTDDPNPIGSAAARRLSVRLVNQGHVKVIDTSLRDLPPEMAPPGRQVGAQAVCLGQLLQNEAGLYVLNVKLVELSSGRILVAVNAPFWE